MVWASEGARRLVGRKLDKDKQCASTLLNEALTTVNRALIGNVSESCVTWSLDTPS